MTFLLIAAVMWPATVAAPRSDAAMPLTAKDLARVASIPIKAGIEPCDPQYEDIVKRGLPVVPDLIDLLADPTPTPLPVCLIGGKYAVGDIAMSAISDIIENIPWLTFITRPDDPRIEAVGFGVYWDYVRKSQENRRILREKVSTWFKENAGGLRWRPAPDHPAGGAFIFEERQKSQPGG